MPYAVTSERLEVRLCTRGNALENFEKNTLSRTADDIQSEVCIVMVDRYRYHMVDTWECKSIDTCERQVFSDTVQLATCVFCAVLRGFEILSL